MAANNDSLRSPPLNEQLPNNRNRNLTKTQIGIVLEYFR